MQKKRKLSDYQKLKLEKVVIERKLMLFTNKSFEEVICQTEYHPDVPNDDNALLPPIFGNQLCWKSRPFHLSNSLPNLEKLSWCQPDYDFTDEAEEGPYQEVNFIKLEEKNRKKIKLFIG